MIIDKSKLIVREILPSEIPTFVKYRLEYIAELQGKNHEEGNLQLQRAMENYFESAIEKGQFLALVAELEGTPISFGGLIIKTIPGDFKQPVYLEGDILNMYTVPEARKQGISSIILERLIEEAKKLGISKLALHASKDGENMYRNFGFSEPKYPYLEMVLNTTNLTH